MKTAHRTECTRVFRRYDAACPRCQELSTGSAPRAGWGDLQRQQAEQTQRAMASHFAPNGPHARGDCGPVCTAFDW